MTPDEVNELLLHVYQLGTRVCSRAHHVEPGAEEEKCWDLLEAVAEGEVRLVERPSRLIVGGGDAISHELQEQAKRSMEAQNREYRELAQRLVALKPRQAGLPFPVPRASHSGPGQGGG